MTACDQHSQETDHQALEPTLPSPVQANKNKEIPENYLYLRFLATGEAFYQEFKLENKIFTYTYFDDKEKRCIQWIQNRPCWMQDDLTSISKPLSEKEIESLYTAISNSGILDITENKLGGAKKGQRFYAQRLEIHMGHIEKLIVYQSYPGSTPKPKAFQIMEKALKKFVPK